MQHPGNRLADASRCAGDERLAAGQFEHVLTSSQIGQAGEFSYL
jgi:hypothetical protein